MLLAVHYRVMEHLGSLESTQEARVALGYRLGVIVPLIRILKLLARLLPYLYSTQCYYHYLLFTLVDIAVYMINSITRLVLGLGYAIKFTIINVWLLYSLNRTPEIGHPRDRALSSWQIGPRRTNHDREFCYRYDY